MNKLNLYTPINSLGYGVVGFNLWKELRKKIDVTLWVIGGEQNIELPVTPTSEIIENLREDIAKQDDYDGWAPCLKIWHENHMAERIGNGPMYGFPFFEVSKFNQRRLSHIKSVDHIIVASNWAKQVLKENKVANTVHVVPCGVDTTIFNVSLSGPAKDRCVFLNCGKWEVRKGHDVLYRAWNDAFGPQDRVELWMMSSNPFLDLNEKNNWESKYNKSNIKVLDRVTYQEQLAEIIGKSFCGVFPSRAEGWNLEALEMMSCGKHVIATNYSAHTEFCDSGNCHLIHIDQEEPIYDGKWFKGDNGVWASLEGNAYNQLVEHLKSVYRCWEKYGTEKVNRKGLATSEYFSWKRAADSITNIIFGA